MGKLTLSIDDALKLKAKKLAKKNKNLHIVQL